MALNIKPLADRVLIEPAAAETKTASGIIIPEAVFVSASKGSINTRSANGLIFNLLISYVLFLIFLNQVKSSKHLTVHPFVPNHSTLGKNKLSL